MKTQDIVVGTKYGVTTKTKWQEQPYYLTEAEVVEIRRSAYEGKTITVRYPSSAHSDRVVAVRPVDVRCTWDEALELKEQARVRADERAEAYRVQRERQIAAEEAWRTAAPALTKALADAGISGAQVEAWRTGYVKFTPEAAAALAEFIDGVVTVEVAA